MIRPRHRHTCTDPDSCPICAWLEGQAEEVAFERDYEPADPQRELEAADREARMDRWS